MICEYIKIIETTTTLLISTKILIELSCVWRASNGSSLNELVCASRKLPYFNVNYRYTSRARTNRRVLEARSVRARYWKYHANDCVVVGSWIDN